MIWWTMTVLHWTCTTVGAGVLLGIAWSFLSEVVRAVRQSHRVAIVHVRVGFGERRRPTWREWWSCFRYEFFRNYSYLTIGFVQIPHNPSERMRGAYHG